MLETSWNILSVSGVGLVFGLKHALDADHLAAVAVIVSQRRGMFRSSLVGALWGLGHTLALLVAAVLMILLHVEISGELALGLELVVALMLIGLGVNALRLLWRGATLHMHVHRHGTHKHVHPHAHTQSDDVEHTHHNLRLGVRPFLVGMVHGVAGSAALMLLVLSTLPTPALGFAYVAAFGAGSMGGMILMSALVGLPLQIAAQRFTQAHTALRYAAALGSVGCGLVLLTSVIAL